MELRVGNIVPVFEKGKKDQAEKYRGITLKDTGYKIHAEILRGRLNKHLEKEERLGDTQMGLRSKRGIVDAIHILKTAIGRGIEREGRKVFVFFADMKGSFDNRSREEVWRTLEELNVEENLR